MVFEPGTRIIDYENYDDELAGVMVVELDTMVLHQFYGSADGTIMAALEWIENAQHLFAWAPQFEIKTNEAYMLRTDIMDLRDKLRVGKSSLNAQ